MQVAENRLTALTVGFFPPKSAPVKDFAVTASLLTPPDGSRQPAAVSRLSPLSGTCQKAPLTPKSAPVKDFGHLSAVSGGLGHPRDRITARSAVRARAAVHTHGLPWALDALRSALSTGPARLVGLRYLGGITAARSGARGGHGEPFTETLAEHAAWCARYGRGVRPKGEGVVTCYGRSKNGGCADEDAEAVTVVYLDCDEAGDWHLLLRRLRMAGAAYLAYRSGGHSAAVPKWRTLLPLSPELPAPPKADYQAELGWLQGLLAEVGELGPAGFDPCVDRLLMPCFPGCRRTPEAAPPEVRLGVGRPLNWRALLRATGYSPPPAPPPLPPPRIVRRDDHDRRIERARLYLAAMPPAIAGQEGHRQTYAAAVALVRGFSLSEDDTMATLSDFNGRCLPPWSEAELRHKVRDAARSRLPDGYLLDADRCYRGGR